MKYDLIRAFLVRAVVAPLAGAWIEIINDLIKFFQIGVAPLAGAWIEISLLYKKHKPQFWVAPLAGAWIEMCYDPQAGMGCIWSLPSRERGLKSRIAAEYC